MRNSSSFGDNVSSCNIIRRLDEKLLQVFENIKKSIAEIDDLKELQNLRNLADGYETAWKKYFRTSGFGAEQMFLGWETKVRSERRMGEMLTEMELDKGGRPSINNNRLHNETSLDDLGISKIQSFRYQKLADILEKIFDKTIEELRREKRRMAIESIRPAESVDSSLINGDTLKELWTIPDNSIDCLITDPPYGIDYQSNMRTASDKFEKIQNAKSSVSWATIIGVCFALNSYAHLKYGTSSCPRKI